MDNLSYPQIKADLDLCQVQLAELCCGKRDKAIMSIPPHPTDFDMQISAAFDEVKAYRDTGLTPEEIKLLFHDGGITIAARNQDLRVERDTLKKALELACISFSKQLSKAYDVPLNLDGTNNNVNYFIKQAQEGKDNAK